MSDFAFTVKLCTHTDIHTHNNFHHHYLKKTKWLNWEGLNSKETLLICEECPLIQSVAQVSERGNGGLVLCLAELGWGNYLNIFFVALAYSREVKGRMHHNGHLWLYIACTRNVRETSSVMWFLYGYE